MKRTRKRFAAFMRANSVSACDVTLQGEATITAAEGTNTPPSFQMMAYGGGPIRPRLEPPMPHPIVVDLAGMDLSRQTRPALKDHDSKQLVGHTTAIATDGQKLTASGVVSGTGAASAEVVGAAKNGFAWPVSIGASLGQIELVKAGATATVNGRTVAGPVFIARSSKLREISFLSMAADEDAVASIAATPAATTTGEGMNPFQKWLAAMGLSHDSLSAEQLSKLQAKFDAEQATAKAGPKSTGNDDLEAVLSAERQKESRRKEIANLTARSLQDNPGHLQIIEAMSHQAIEGDWEPQRYELELLRATRPTASGRRRDRNGEELSSQVVEAAVCLAGGIGSPEKHFSEQVLDAATRRWRHGLGLNEMLMLFARRNGYDGLSSRDVAPVLRAAFAEPAMLMASGPSTLSLPGILGNVANKFLKMGFDAVESGWRGISAIRPVRDFKQISSYSLTGDFQYIEVPAGGELKHANVGEETYTNQAKTYGRLFGIDRRDIINDDLGALTQVPQRLGRGAALKLNDVFWTEFMDNSAFFTTGNVNYLSGVTVGTNDSRLNIEGLTRAETAFFNQTDPDSKPLGITPKILLVPNALWSTAANLMNSTEYRDTTANTAFGTMNPHAGKYTVVRSSYLSNSSYTGYSSVAWYLLATPADLPVIETCFLNGVETPTVDSADADFNMLGIQMRGYHDFGVNLQEYRGGVKSKGAA